VKATNPMKRKKPITRQLHHYDKKFESVSQLKSHITDELTEEMPNHASTDVGYFVGRQSAKVWLISNKDLEKMYQKCKVGSKIALWCDVQSLDET